MSGEYNIVELMFIGLKRFRLSVSLYTILTTEGGPPRCLESLNTVSWLKSLHPTPTITTQIYIYIYFN